MSALSHAALAAVESKLVVGMNTEPYEALAVRLNKLISEQGKQIADDWVLAAMLDRISSESVYSIRNNEQLEHTTGVASQ